MKVYPYKRITGEIALEVTAVRQEREGYYQHDLETWCFSAQEKVVALHQIERDDWESARLAITAKLPAQEIASGPWSDVAVVAVLTESVTNARVTARLTRAPGASETWSGHLRLWRSMHHRRAELAIVVVGSVDGEPGRMIGRSDSPWIVDFAAAKPVRQNEMEIVEEDFVQGPEWLRPFKDAPWIVETSGDMPRVHLNTAFEGVTDLLNSARDPMSKAMRNMLAAQIATDVWTAVFHAAVGDLELNEYGEPEWPGGWRDAVLKSMLGDVLPDLSPDDALREIHSRRAEASGWNDLQARISYAAGRRAKVAKNLGAAIRTVDAAQRESR
ncbi:hypothetical protein [Streptomyces sp. NPDC002640]